MVLRINEEILQNPMPRYEGKRVMVAIDSSKTNSAIVVNNEYGEMIDRIELNGKEAGTTLEAVLALCQQEREVLKVLFRGSTPFIVGIENIITKTNREYTTGMDTHMSRFKITAVFMSFISFFQDTFGITPELINNQTWKAAVLPEEFRSRDYHKGSLAYLRSIHSKYASCSDDVTDAICIMEYLKMKHEVRNIRRIEGPEASRNSYQCWLVSLEQAKKYDGTLFAENPNMNVTQQAVVMANAIKPNAFAKCTLNIENVTFPEIYTMCAGKHTFSEPKIVLLVQRL